MSLSILLTWLLAALLLPAAQPPDGLTLSAQAGFDGLYEGGEPIPVIVTAGNDGPPIEGELRVVVTTAGEELYFSAPISLPTGSDKRVPLVVHTSNTGARLRVRLVSDGQLMAEVDVNRLNNVGRSDLFYGVITSNPGGLAFLETIHGGRADASVAFLETAELPEVSAAWQALDVLILDDTDTSRLTAGQLDAMRAWLDDGGQLVVTGGPGGPTTAAGVADLLPVAVGGVESVPDVAALSEFAGEPFSAPGPYVITTSRLTTGELLIHDDGMPILARRDWGRGSVFFLALDPKLPPLAGWPGGEQLWEAIAANAPLTPPWAGGIQEGYAAAQAVSFIPGLRLPSIWQLFLFLVIYTVVIGPINFLILRRMNRRELAWITIPALVLLFSAVTFFTGFSTRGNTATLNAMSVAYGSIDAERLRTQTVLGLYSPRRARYDIALPLDATAFPFQEGFGTVVNGGNVGAVERTGELALRDVRTDTSEVATFIVESHTPRPAIEAEATLSADGRTLNVTVRNRTDRTLENGVIVYGSDVGGVGADQTGVGDVAPGGEQSVVVSLPPPAPASTAPTPSPMFPPGFVYPNPLFNDPSLLLGTADYYNDPEAYPRWQLLLAHYTGESGNPDTVPDPTQRITLAGFMEGSAQETVVTGDRPAEQTGLTLLLLEIPVR